MKEQSSVHTQERSRPPFLVRAYREWRKDEVIYLSSALTFDAIAAAVPFMMLVLAVVGLLVTMVAAGGELDLRTLLRGVFPEARIVDLDPLLRVERLLDGVAERRTTLSAVSMPLLIVLATRMFGTVRWTLNRVFDAPEPRHPVHQWMVDLSLTLVTGFFLMANGIASIGLTIVATTTGVDWYTKLAGAVVTFVSAVCLFVLIFRLAPSREIDWTTAWLAGGCSAIFFELAKRGFSLYVDFAARLDVLTPDAQLAGVMLLLGWFYLNALVFLSVGELANEYYRRKSSSMSRSLEGATGV